MRAIVNGLLCLALSQVLAASGSAQSAEQNDSSATAAARIMAELGVGIMIIAQKPWPTCLAELDQYRAIYREVNGGEAPRPLLVSFTAVRV